MIDLKCKKCVTVIGQRENDTIQFGGITVHAPAEVMCSKCGTINTFPETPTIAPQVTPVPVVIVDPKVNPGGKK